MENNTCTGIALGSFGRCGVCTTVQHVCDTHTLSSIVRPCFGSNIANYNFWSGYTQHIYMGANSIQHVWGSDREVMTTAGPCSPCSKYRLSLT